MNITQNLEVLQFARKSQRFQHRRGFKSEGDPGNVLPADGRLEESHPDQLESASKHEKLLPNSTIT